MLADRTNTYDHNNQVSIGLAIGIPIIFSFILVGIVTAAIFYRFRKSLGDNGQVLKQSLLACCRTLLCCKKRAGVEALYDVPDYYAAPPLPPRIELEEDINPGNQDDNLSLMVPNIEPIASNVILMNQTAASVHLDSDDASDEARAPEVILENVSYLPGRTSISHLAENPAHGTSIATAPEILTEENEAYELGGVRDDNHGDV